MPKRNMSKAEAARILGPVEPERAFYFYRGLEQPLGSSSRSAIEFAEVVKDLDPASVQFHLERGDFENWFRMLGDQTMVNQLATLRKKSTPMEQLGPIVSTAVRLRVTQLQKTAGNHNKKNS